MTIATPQLNIQDQAYSLIDTLKEINYRKHYEQTISTILLIAAWIVVIAQTIYKGWQFAAPHIINGARQLADFIESLDDSPPPIPLIPETDEIPF